MHLRFLSSLQVALESCVSTVAYKRDYLQVQISDTVLGFCV